MIKKLIHKLKLRFGKKTKIALPHIIDGVTHATDEVFISYWGGVTIPWKRKPDNEETH